MKTSLAILTGCLVLVFASCSSEVPENTTTKQVAPERLYETQQCLLCHGPGGRGTPGTGPDLRSIDEHWDVDSLMEYLTAPKEYADKNERLRENRSKYRMQMPNTRLEGERLRVLAEYVLSLE